MPHLYLLISEIPPGWTNEERDKAWVALKGRGKQHDANPARITHMRTRPDNQALIVEGVFTDAELTRAGVVATIAQALNVQPNAVDAKINYEVFGGTGATWEQSRQAALAFLAANRAAWDAETP